MSERETSSEVSPADHLMGFVFDSFPRVLTARDDDGDPALKSGRGFRTEIAPMARL